MSTFRRLGLLSFGYKSIESSVHAEHKGISFSFVRPTTAEEKLKGSTKHLQNWIHYVMYSTLWWSYEAAIRTTVISVKRAFKCYLFIMCVWFDQNFMIHEVCVSLTWNIASTQTQINDISIESSLELNAMTYSSVLYDQPQLHKSWKHLENTFQIGCILRCIPFYEGHTNMGLIRLWRVRRDLSNDIYFDV